MQAHLIQPQLELMNLIYQSLKSQKSLPQTKRDSTQRFIQNYFELQEFEIEHVLVSLDYIKTEFRKKQSEDIRASQISRIADLP